MARPEAEAEATIEEAAGEMNVAVITLCRDRLLYSKHCIATLREMAGIHFDHYVLDNGSTDGTREWLLDEFKADRFAKVILVKENVGINRGVNMLLDELEGDYDVVVKIDNDAEITIPFTLADVAQLVDDGYAILSPRILGLNNPPVPIGEFEINGERILQLTHVGGIFLAAPGWIYKQFRHREDAALYGSDDGDVCVWFRRHGGRVGYVETLSANHFETTSGQHARYPEYFARTLAEGKPSL